MSQAVLAALRERFPEGIVDTHSYLGDETAIVRPEALRAACEFLAREPNLALQVLMDLTCVDYLGRQPRFEVVYHLYSPTHRHRVRLKVALVDVEGGAPAVDSVATVWPAANWYEREAWDLYGIRFRDHPDLRRILLYEEFQGHPLRKDYPKELRQPLVRRARPA